MVRGGALALLLACSVHSALADDFLRPGDTISGKLQFFRHQHPNGTWIQVYQVTSDHHGSLTPRMSFAATSHRSLSISS